MLKKILPKLTLIATITILLAGCSFYKQETDPLLIPPEFDVMPNLAEESEKPEQQDNSLSGGKSPPKKQDLERLKSLILE